MTIYMSNASMNDRSDQLQKNQLTQNDYRDYIKSLNNVETLSYQLITRGMSQKTMESLVSELKKAEKHLNQTVSYFEKTSEISNHLPALHKTLEQYKEIYQTELKETADDELKIARIKVSPKLQNLNEKIKHVDQKIEEHFHSFNKEERVKTQEGINQSNAIIIISSLVLIIAPILIVVIFARDLKKGVNGILKRINHYSDGDFTYTDKISRKDEFGEIDRSLTSMGNALKEAIRTSIETSQNVMEITGNVKEQTDKNNQKADSVKAIAAESLDKISSQYETTSSISAFVEEASSSTQQVQASVDLVNGDVGIMNDVAKKGNIEMINLVESVTAIIEKSHHLSDKIMGIEKEMENISNFVNGINKISSQTNLLALNASIEAARAGEHGKGFMVVAEEIRKLSSETNNFSTQINEIVAKVKDETVSTVKEFKAFDQIIDGAKQTSNKASETFEDIVDKSDHVNVRVNEVRQAMEQIAKGVDEMVESINELVESSSYIKADTKNVSHYANEQKNITEEVACAVYELNKAANRLKGSTSMFKI